LYFPLLSLINTTSPNLYFKSCPASTFQPPNTTLVSLYQS
jgi:hypothetical protein